MAAQAPAERIPFVVSRDYEYFTERELTSQIGFGKAMWPIALIKELIDNGLDECERQGIAPVISICVNEDSFSVEDNGTGIPPEVVEQSLDYNVRVSSNSRYVSPSRGALGNALKCLWTAPYVACGEQGTVIVRARGAEHHVGVRMDGIAGRPVVEHEARGCAVKTGTFLQVGWPNVPSYLGSTKVGEFYHEQYLARAYALLNPHATIYLNETRLFQPERAFRKWNACEPTSARWYSLDRFVDLLAALLQHDRNAGTRRLLRDLVGNFDGLTGTSKKKQVLEQAGLGGVWLEDLADEKGVSKPKALALLKAMRATARPIQAKALGQLGKKVLERGLTGLFGVDGKVRHRCQAKTIDGVPFVVEAAVGYNADLSADFVPVVGINWSPTLRSPFRWLDAFLTQECEIETEDPLVLFLHVVCPTVGYTDRGKGSAELPPGVADVVKETIRWITKAFTKEKKQTARQDQLSMRRLEKLQKGVKRQADLKALAFGVMVEAHAHVSGGVVSAPVMARQLMYAVRRLMSPLTEGLDKRFWKNSKSFTQGVLIDFLEAHPELAKVWKIVFDGRGTFREPHSGRSFSIGTQEVEEYIKRWTGATWDELPEDGEGAEVEDVIATCLNNAVGPRDRYQAVLFVEKEGFDELLRHARLAERYDLGLCSTKGLSTTSMRKLVVALTKLGIPLLVLHDFDRAGLLILKTLTTDTRRFKFEEPPNVIDLGLRLGDVRTYDLEGEEVEYRMKNSPTNAIAGMAEDRECAYLVEGRRSSKLWAGRRVELNEFTNEELIAFIETKMKGLGLDRKVVPDLATLQRGFEVAAREAFIETRLAEARRQAEQEARELHIEVPSGLSERIAKAIRGEPIPWNKALADLANEHREGW